MVIYMSDKKIKTVGDVQSFLDGTVEVEFSITDKDACYRWMQHTLVKLSYLTCSKKEKGLIARYLGQVSGYSPRQVKRLIQQYRKTGSIKRQQRTVAGFERFYRTADAVLLAETDKLHGTLSGGATKKICERMLLLYDDARYERLAKISVGHLYNLRHSNGYQRQRRQFDKTSHKRSQIGERRKPTPEGTPGYLRIDTVHQGDLDGIKGVYHINAVDEVTQFECVFSVERITERFMIPVLEMIIKTFPFMVHAFHADNGSEYINHRVSKLLDKLHIEFTKSRPRHSNDNALAESKNGTIIRKHLGYDHIPGYWAPQLNAFHHDYFNPYLNFHRPCFFPVANKDKKGKVRKSYPYKAMMTPFEKLKSLPDSEGHLKPGTTFEKLDEIILSISDNEAAKQMNEAKHKLYKSIFEQKQSVA